MRIANVSITFVLLFLSLVHPAVCEEILFEDNFAKGLSSKWEVVGLTAADYRIREGGLELRVQPGKPNGKTPMLKVMLPFTTADSVVVSVKVTVLNDFTDDKEHAGVVLLDENGVEFQGKKERVNGKLVFSPGHYRFKGQPGDEGDPKHYDVEYTAATKEAGALRIISDRGIAYFQVGPSPKDEYVTFFHSAINKK